MRLAGHESTVWAVAFNTSGSQMVSCSADTTLRIWNCTSNADGEQEQLPWVVAVT